MPTASTRARNAVALVFAVNGFGFASWVSRIPEARGSLGLTPGELGILLLALSLGAVVALPFAGWWVHRAGAGRAVAVSAVADAAGLVVAGVGAGVVQEPWLAGAGLFLTGLGAGVWDVAMNVEGAQVERALGRAVMSRFHAAFSIGTVAGATSGALAARLEVPLAVHLAVASLVVAAAPLSVVRAFLPAARARPGSGRAANSLRAWTEPRTLALGAMVFSMALTEGVANDWLAVALVDGYDAPTWAGSAGFALFVTAMTVARLAGPAVLRRYGRTSVLWGSLGLAVTGVVVVVVGAALPVPALSVVLGVVLWGLGTALGFPVGMSAAADEPEHAAARVSVVASIGYTAFLAGPPLLGFLGDKVGALHALLVVGALALPAMLAVPATRPPVPPVVEAGGDRLSPTRKAGQ